MDRQSDRAAFQDGLDRVATGNYGEDSILEMVDIDSIVTDPTLDILGRILGDFDLDIFAEGSRFTGLTYTVRLWEEGERVAEASGDDLESVLLQIDQTAEALVRAYCA